MSEQEETKEKYSVYCSFCEKSNHDVFNIIANNGHYICNECIAAIVGQALKHPVPKETDPEPEEPIGESK